MVAVLASKTPVISLEDWMENPIEGTEWVNGELIERQPMTLKHSKIQSHLARQWGNYAESSGQDGIVYTESPCRTHKQGRVPDVAYLPPDLFSRYGQEKVLPQSFPLCAEIVSPTDLAEETIAKASEYLLSGSGEVWLIFPENRWIITITPDRRQIFISGETVRSASVLSGFQTAIDELLA